MSKFNDRLDADKHTRTSRTAQFRDEKTELCSGTGRFGQKRNCPHTISTFSAGLPPPPPNTLRFLVCF